MDAELMRNKDICKRRFEAEMMHRYGDRYLHSNVFDDQPVVMVGNPEQVVIIHVDD